MCTCRPFTVFTTGQKKSMLKWLDRLNGLEAEAGGAAAAGAEQEQQYSILDVTSDVAEVGDILCSWTVAAGR
jgi:hypothetical protein